MPAGVTDVVPACEGVPRGRDVKLSTRQREVLGLLAEGLSPRLIAARLGIKETTTRNHIQGLLHRLGCHSQLEAVARAHQWRLF